MLGGELETQICLVWGEGNFAWGLPGAGLSLLRLASKFIIFTIQIAQFIITPFPDFRIFGFRNRIPQVGFLRVCLGFAWGVMSQCLGTYDLRCLLGDLILFCLGMNFSSGVLGDVVFRVLFAWGRRFRHLFCLGICLGWICLGL